MKSNDYKCEACGNVFELAGDHEAQVFMRCIKCREKTLHRRVWNNSKIIIPKKFRWDKPNPNEPPRIHKIR